jgi:hypothetical protein
MTNGLLPFQDKQETLKQRALRWLRDNPDARRLFRRYATEMADHGIPFGIGALVERVRWQHLLEYQDDDGHVFKINNSYRAYIARWLIAHDPRLADLVRCRRTPSANLPARTPVAAATVNPLEESDE